jgi:nucleotide-binding universal stress UspA family protein
MHANLPASALQEEPQTWRLVVPLDGTPLASRALPWADHLAEALEASITLVHVVQPGKPTPTSFDANRKNRTLILLGVVSQHDHAEAMPAYLPRVEADLHAGLVPIRLEVGWGDPAGQILEFARAQNVDLIAMATRGRQERNPFALNGVTETVLAQALTPVLVQHPAPARPSRGPRSTTTATVSP